MCRGKNGNHEQLCPGVSYCEAGRRLHIHLGRFLNCVAPGEEASYPLSWEQIVTSIYLAAVDSWGPDAINEVVITDLETGRAVCHA